MQNTNFTVNHGPTRTIVQVPIKGDPAAVNAAVEAVLSGDGYAPMEYTKTGTPETVWKKGTGLLTAMKFIKLVYQPNMLIIAGWTAGGLGPWIMSEMPLDGFVGAAPKASCMNTIKKAVAAAQNV